MIKYMLILHSNNDRSFSLLLNSELGSYELFEYLETIKWLKGYSKLDYGQKYDLVIVVFAIY